MNKNHELDDDTDEEIDDLTDEEFEAVADEPTEAINDRDTLTDEEPDALTAEELEALAAPSDEERNAPTAEPANELDALTAEEKGDLDTYEGDDYTFTRDSFKQLYQSYRDQGVPMDEETGILRLDDYPDVEFHPNGDVFGPYEKVREYLKEHELAHKPGGTDLGFETHHLLQHHSMQHFGIDRDDGLSVALDHEEHREMIHGASDETGKNYLNFELPKGMAFDIEDVIESHVTFYQEYGRPEWGERLRAHVREHREQIIDAYENGKVVGANGGDVQRAKRYLRDL